MIKKKYLEGLIWLLLSIFLCIKTSWLGLGTFSTPGPGFTPFVVALCLFSLSLILFIQAILSQKEKVVKRLDLRMSAFYIFCSIVVYVFLFKKIGYLFSTFLLMTFLFRCMGTKWWGWVLGGAFLVTFLSYLFFGVILKLNLPTVFF
jgi:hypothetical protein